MIVINISFNYSLISTIVKLHMQNYEKNLTFALLVYLKIWKGFPKITFFAVLTRIYLKIYFQLINNLHWNTKLFECVFVHFDFAFPQNFNTRKLGEISAFYAVIPTHKKDIAQAKKFHEFRVIDDLCAFNDRGEFQKLYKEIFFFYCTFAKRSWQHSIIPTFNISIFYRTAMSDIFCIARSSNSIVHSFEKANTRIIQTTWMEK